MGFLGALFEEAILLYWRRREKKERRRQEEWERRYQQYLQHRTETEILGVLGAVLAALLIYQTALVAFWVAVAVSALYLKYLLALDAAKQRENGRAKKVVGASSVNKVDERLLLRQPESAADDLRPTAPALPPTDGFGRVAEEWQGSDAVYSSPADLDKGADAAPRGRGSVKNGFRQKTKTLRKVFQSFKGPENAVGPTS